MPLDWQNVKEGDRVSYEDQANPRQEGEVVEILDDGQFRVRFDASPSKFGAEFGLPARETTSDLRQHGWNVVLAETVTANWYDDVARVYAETYGEPLVADADWVGPLFEACEIAVSAGADMSYEQFASGARHEEVVARTAAVIAVMTHGVRPVVEAAVGEMP